MKLNVELGIEGWWNPDAACSFVPLPDMILAMGPPFVENHDS